MKTSFIVLSIMLVLSMVDRFFDRSFDRPPAKMDWNATVEVEDWSAYCEIGEDLFFFQLSKRLADGSNKQWIGLTFGK